jgi:predicted ferric reductase
MKQKLGRIFIIVLALIPLALWISMQPLSERFLTVYSSFRSIGQIFALSGVVLFSLTFILNARIKSLEDYFGGLDKMLRVHHLTGTIAFILLLFHPLFLAASMLQFSLMHALQLLIPSANWPINFGIIALFIMEVLLVITFYVNLKYQKWKFSHKWLGLAFIIAAIHVLLINSDISINIYLRSYILFMVVVGIYFFIHRTIIGRATTKIYKYSVEKVKKLNKQVVEITLVPDGEKIVHEPSQFVFVSFKDDAITSESHPFTISSSPDEKNLRFTIKNLGDFTSNLSKIKKGTLVEITGPHGAFYRESYEKSSQIWISGGIGITPFLSLARSMKTKKNTQLVELYCSFKTKEEELFVDELMQISKNNKHFKVYSNIASKDGFLTAEKIAKKSRDLHDREILICGPPIMINELREQLRALGVPNGKIHSEEFDLM